MVNFVGGLLDWAKFHQLCAEFLKGKNKLSYVDLPENELEYVFT